MSRRAYRGAGALLLALVVAAWAAAVPALAHPLPDNPDATEYCAYDEPPESADPGDSPEVAQLKAMRSDLYSMCNMQEYYLRADHDTLSQIDGAVEDLRNGDGQPQAVKLAPGSIGSDSDHPALVSVTNLDQTPPASGTVALSDDDRALMASMFDGLHGDLWYGIGVLLAGVAGYVIYRQVMPRA